MNPIITFLESRMLCSKRFQSRSFAHDFEVFFFSLKSNNKNTKVQLRMKVLLLSIVLIFNYCIECVTAVNFFGHCNHHDEEFRKITDFMQEIQDQNILLKAINLSILDLLLTMENQETPQQKTKVLSIARSLSKRHKREQSVMPWDPKFLEGDEQQNLLKKMTQ